MSTPNWVTKPKAKGMHRHFCQISETSPQRWLLNKTYLKHLRLMLHSYWLPKWWAMFLPHHFSRVGSLVGRQTPKISQPKWVLDCVGSQSIIIVGLRGLRSSYLQAMDSYEVMGCNNNKGIAVAKRANEMHQGIDWRAKWAHLKGWQHT